MLTYLASWLPGCFAYLISVSLAQWPLEDTFAVVRIACVRSGGDPLLVPVITK